MDEQIKFGFAYAKNDSDSSPYSYSIGTSVIWFGKGKIDQTAQGERTKGEFSTNYAVFLGGTLRYQF